MWADRTPEGPRAPQLDRSWTLLGAMKGPTQPDIPPAAEKFDTPNSEDSRGNAWCVAWNGDDGREWDGDNDGRHDDINNIVSLPEIR